MFRRIIHCAAVAILPAACLFADFSYEQTSKITGGMMAGMMRFAGAFSKQAREPIKTTVAVKGDRMAHLSATQNQIIDVAKETITMIDLQKKTYSVMTFAQMQQMMEEASQKMKEAREQNKGAEMNYKVSTNKTGQTKQIAGLETTEMVMKMEMESTDPKTGNKGSMLVTADMWIAPSVPGHEEVAAFYKKMAQKLAGWGPGGGMMMAQPEVQKGLAEAYKEAFKLNGMPVYQTTTMGFAGQGMPAGAGSQPSSSSAPPPQQQPQPQTQPQAEKPTAGGALAGALGGRFGGLGGLGRRRKSQEPKQDEAPAASQQPAGQTAQPAGDASGALMEMVTEYSGFSTATVDASRFEVPAGFKQVEPDMRRGRR